MVGHSVNFLKYILVHCRGISYNCFYILSFSFIYVYCYSVFFLYFLSVVVCCFNCFVLVFILYFFNLLD